MSFGPDGNFERPNGTDMENGIGRTGGDEKISCKAFSQFRLVLCYRSCKAILWKILYFQTTCLKGRIIGKSSLFAGFFREGH